VCAPVREPRTLTRCSERAGTPRKLIWVHGEASRLPASGETLTDPAWSAETLRVAGVHGRAAFATAAQTSASAVASPTMSIRMQSMDPRQHRKINRRTFLRGGLIAGGALAGTALGVRATEDNKNGAARATRPRAPGSGGRAPNILVIVVDQLRFPQWSGAGSVGATLPPNIAALSEGAVSFARHYAASNDCTPARSTLLTGLYTHQTGCMITGGSTLDPGFPTWGTMLREHGYATRWLGKWHLTHHDNHWGAGRGEHALQGYGFAGGVFPSPDGAPGQGWRIDPLIARKFDEWFALEGGVEPWCTTVSFVNPHDIAWWYVWSNRIAGERSARRVTRKLPPNYETPELLLLRRKPRLQHSLQETAAASFGPVPYEGPDSERSWLAFLDLYAKLQREVDQHVGRVLHTLSSRPEVAANTVVILTADHGEYGASHGLRGKGASGYEEAIRVPLIVKDLRGILTDETESPRTQLTSSVDVAPLLLTIATGSEEWRRDEHYSHISHRLPLAPILGNSGAPGREYVLHATDEVVTEFAIAPFAADAPLHVVALRTTEGKYATYSHWARDRVTPMSQGEETELYDYSTHLGRLEVQNVAGESDLESRLRSKLADAVHYELRAPLPVHLRHAQARGFADYFSTARANAKSAAARRRRLGERDIGSIEAQTPPRARGSVSRVTPSGGVAVPEGSPAGATRRGRTG
jgi:arylsulfatase A-like enzyme